MNHERRRCSSDVGAPAATAAKPAPPEASGIGMPACSDALAAGPGGTAGAGAAIGAGAAAGLEAAAPAAVGTGAAPGGASGTAAVAGAAAAAGFEATVPKAATTGAATPAGLSSAAGVSAAAGAATAAASGLTAAAGASGTGAAADAAGSYPRWRTADLMSATSSRVSSYRTVALPAAKFTVTLATPGTAPIRFSTSSTLNTDSMPPTSITLVFIVFPQSASSSICLAISPLTPPAGPVCEV